MHIHGSAQLPLSGDHTCKLHIKINNLSESCANNGTNPASSTLTVSGICPTATVPNGKGTINCLGGGAGGADPTFCSYAGSDPAGNTSKGCTWNLGWGAKQGQKVVPMTQNQCQAAFGSTKVVYSFNQILEGAVCAQNAQIIDMGETGNKFCHSDTWNPAQAAFCDLKGSQVKNTAEATVANFLTVDTEYSPTTINADCRPGKDQGGINLTILGNNLEPHSTNNSIAVQAINQATITVNASDDPNFPVFKPDSCSFPNPDTLACRVPSCINGHSVVENTINLAKKTATLTMEACIGTVDAQGVCVGTRVVGDLETRKVSGL